MNPALCNSEPSARNLMAIVLYIAVVEFNNRMRGSTTFEWEYPCGFRLANSFAKKSSTSLRFANMLT